MLQGGQPATQGGGGDFRDIHGREDTGGTDAEAAEHACGDEDVGGFGRAGGVGAGEEDDGGHQHGRTTAQEIGNVTGEESADGTTEEDGGDGKTGGDGRRAEGGGDGVHGAVDDAAVEAEKETADGGHGGHEKDKGVTAGRRRGGVAGG